MNREEAYEKSLVYFNGDSLAADAFLNKYALTDGPDSYLESTPRDMHKRLASEFARIEKEVSSDPMTEAEIFSLLDHFKYVVPQGSPMYGIGNPKPVSLSNCAVIESPEDDMSSIMDTGKRMALLYKRRYGVGVDISKLRPEGSKVNNAAETSTGAWSFADLYSYITRMVGQAGRRGALMITMDIRHPDIEKFIIMKSQLDKVTGANVSVRISDEFMEAVESDDTFELKFPVDAEKPQIKRVIQARELWGLLTETATETAEPGLLMWDNITKNLPAHYYSKFKTISTNPCGELPLSAQDSCRLISINLTSFVENSFENDAYFDFEKFEEVVRKAMRLSDDLVSLELEKIEQIMDECDSEKERKFFKKFWDAAYNGRRTGLGTHGLGDCLARLRVAYDSKKAQGVIEEIYSTLREKAYDESVEMAIDRGAFPDWRWEHEKDCAYWGNFDDNFIEKMKKHGRRNISLLTNAPTGTVSLVSQTSSGIEPIFRLSHTRRRKKHTGEKAKTDYVDALGDEWINYSVERHSLKEYHKITGKEDIPEFFKTSDKIDWRQRVIVQGIISNHIDHSISSTINLPRGTSPEVVSNLYREAWKSGCKGITVYVEGSRDGVLISGDDDARDTPQRPETLECDIHNVKIEGEDWTILVGLLGGKPYEVLGGKASKIKLSSKHSRGTITKKKYKTVPNKYELLTEDKSVKIKDVVSSFNNPDHSVLTRMVSLGMRHGAKPSFLVEQLKKDPSANVASFSRVLSRVLKNYVDFEDVDSAKVQVAQECLGGGEHEIVFKEGCVQCEVCGWTKCD